MRRRASRSVWLGLALLAGGCAAGVRSGTVHQGHLKYGPFWSYPTIYEGELSLGRPKVSVPAEPDPERSLDDE